MVDIVKMELLGPCDHSLSIGERSGLQVSKLQRKHEESLERPLKFWGKILADDADYLICYTLLTPTLEQGEFPIRRYYYATAADTTLRLLPELSAEYSKLAAALPANTRFQGDPSVPLDAEPEEQPQTDEEQVCITSYHIASFEAVLALHYLKRSK